MNGSTILIIHNIGYIIDSALVLFLTVFMLVKGGSRKEVRMVSYAFLFVFIFTLSHVIGVNVSDPYVSRDILMANLANLFLSVFFAHFFFLVTDTEKEEKYPLIIIYSISFILLAFYIIFPDQFLLPSVPKLYFPNYYVAGPLDWMMRLWSNIIVPVYFLGRTIWKYPTFDHTMKNRIKYLFSGTIFGYFFGAFAIPLVFFVPPVIFGVLIDPVWSILFVPLFTIPFTYAVIKYELADIRIVAKQALGYFVLIEAVGILISLFIFFTDYIRQTFPAMPVWILPTAFAIVFVSIGVLIWKRLSETDVLKYEFITVVTHKFRTPLTRIKWAAEDMTMIVPEGKKKNIDAILESERQLLSLTDMLVHLSAADLSRFDYHLGKMDINNLFADLSVQYNIRAERKGIHLTFSAAPGMAILADAEKSGFIFQILLDNAFNYTPAGGSISVRAYKESDNRHGIIEVKDTGIGMSKETASLIFKRFYRGENARHTDTEGMGIGLFIAKSIVEKQDGKIYVKSDGEGKGSTFSIHFPLYKDSGRRMIH